LLWKRYQNWQKKRTDRVTKNLEGYFVVLEKKKKELLFFAPFIFAGLGFILLRNLLGLVIGFVFGLGFPSLMARKISGDRIKKVQKQLVDTLMILSSCLKGGLSFLQAIEVVSEEMPAPISEEFGLILKENKLGIELGVSLDRFKKRVPLEEVKLMVNSILVARETGGEFSRVIFRLIETIRNNLKLKEKINTMTLMGKMQGWIMSVLPLVFVLFISKQDPEHFKVMFQSEQGRFLIMLGVGLWIVGVVAIKKISTLKM
jgi:tight adherence protein B